MLVSGDALYVQCIQDVLGHSHSPMPGAPVGWMLCSAYDCAEYYCGMVEVQNERNRLLSQ